MLLGPSLLWLVSVAAAVGGPLAPVPAPAAPASHAGSRGLVIVLSAPGSDELTRTTLARVVGELTAARFRMSMMPLTGGADPTQEVEAVAPESDAIAAFAITRAPVPNGGDTIAVWVCDRLSGRTTIQRMPVRGENVSQEAELLALQAIELIRASIAGLWWIPNHPPASLAATGASPSSDGGARLRRGPRLTLGLGAAMLADAGLPGPEWLVSLRGLARWSGGLGLRVDVAGLGPALTVSAAEGSARVNRRLVVVGPAWTIRGNDRLALMLTMAFGAAHVTAQGTATDVGRSVHSAHAWAVLGAAGIAATARLGGPIGVFVAADVLWSWPAVNLDIAGTISDPFARPALLLNAGLHAEF